jgi:hypothetical protein
MLLERICKRCGSRFDVVHRRGPSPVYCSRRCIDLYNRPPRHRVTHKCENCGGSFVGQNRETRYCSSKCRSVGSKIDRSCPKCGVVVKMWRGQLCCSQRCANRSRVRTIGECVMCGLAFAGTPLQRFCSRRCALRLKGMKRRAIKRGVFIEDVTLDFLCNRDGRNCRLCGGEIDWTKFGHHPKSPSIDHVIPLARGGIHCGSNMQLAHFGCNAAKGARLPALA